jgi:hypothetical protein
VHLTLKRMQSLEQLCCSFESLNMPKESQVKLMLLNLCKEVRAIIVVFLTCPSFVSNDKALADMSHSLV